MKFKKPGKKGVVSPTLAVGFGVLMILTIIMTWVIADAVVLGKIMTDVTVSVKETGTGIDTVYSAPENVIWSYDVPKNKYGLPVYGSFLISADKKKICVSSLTQVEMFSEIFRRTVTATAITHLDQNAKESREQFRRERAAQNMESFEREEEKGNADAGAAIHEGIFGLYATTMEEPYLWLTALIPLYFCSELRHNPAVDPISAAIKVTGWTCWATGVGIILRMIYGASISSFGITVLTNLDSHAASRDIRDTVVCYTIGGNVEKIYADPPNCKSEFSYDSDTEFKIFWDEGDWLPTTNFDKWLKDALPSSKRTNKFLKNTGGTSSHDYENRGDKGCLELGGDTPNRFISSTTGHFFGSNANSELDEASPGILLSDIGVWLSGIWWITTSVISSFSYVCPAWLLSSALEKTGEGKSRIFRIKRFFSGLRAGFFKGVGCYLAYHFFIIGIYMAGPEWTMNYFYNADIFPYDEYHYYQFPARIDVNKTINPETGGTIISYRKHSFYRETGE